MGLILSLTLCSFTFPALKIKVTKRPVILYDIKVHYGNGSVQDLKTRIHIPAVVHRGLWI